MTEPSQGFCKCAWHAYVLLHRPRRVQSTLTRLVDNGVITQAPNLWQLEQGVMRMWHRVFFRPNSIGTSNAARVRKGMRAALLKVRFIRGAFLLLEGAIAPWDQTGLASSSKRVIKHLLAAHHDGHQFDYDLSILKGDPGALESLRSQVLILVQTDNRRHRWLKDLVVYEGYHEALLEAVERYLSVCPLLDAQTATDPDITFEGYIHWCLKQPASPRKTWRAWRTHVLGHIDSTS